MTTARRPGRRPRPRLLLAALAAGALVATTTGTVSADPSSDPSTAPDTASSATASADTLQRLLDDLADDTVGVTAEVVGPNGTWRGSAGDAQLRPTSPARSDARFRAASITKQLLTVATLRLVEQGRLSLDTTIGERLPGVLPDYADVTLEQLLSHTSGIPDFLDALIVSPYWRDLVTESSERRTDRELVRAAATLPPLGEDDRAYSNTNFVLAGMMVREATGLRLGKALNRLVFRPAGMWQTVFDTSSGLAAPRLKEYGIVGGQARTIASFNPTIFSGAGAVVSTARDLDRFQKALSDGRLVPPATVRLMRTPVSTIDGLGYGLGTMVLPDPCDPEGSVVTGHNGGSFGTISWSLSSADGSRRVAIAYSGRNYGGKPVQGDVDFFLTALAQGCETPPDAATMRRLSERLSVLDLHLGPQRVVVG